MIGAGLSSCLKSVQFDLVWNSVGRPAIQGPVSVSP